MPEALDEKELARYAAWDPNEGTDFSSYRSAAAYAREIVRLRKELEASQQDAARFAKLRKLAHGRCTVRPNLGGFYGGCSYDNARYDISVPVRGRYIDREKEALTQSFTDALDALEESTDAREETEVPAE